MPLSAPPNLDNWLWVTFTRMDPARDVHGFAAFTQDKHWGCQGPLIFDARKKPGYPRRPELEVDAEAEAKAAAALVALKK